MRTAKECAEIFSNMPKNDPIGLWYLDKSDVIERLDGHELEDKDGNPIELETFVTNSFMEEVIERMSDDDYLWERFSETFSDVILSVAEKIIEQVDEDKELWDTEMEKANG